MGLSSISVGHLLAILKSDDEWNYGSFWVTIHYQDDVLYAGYSNCVPTEIQNLNVHDAHIVWNNAYLIINTLEAPNV